MALVVLLYCHVCRQAQRNRSAYRDHLLRAHGEVMRRGRDTPVRLVGHEIEAIWSANRRRQLSGPERAARRREALGLPQVSNREAARRLYNNRDRSARRFRAAARARERAPAPVIDVPTLSIGTTPATPLPRPSPPGRSYSPCDRCLNCHCRVEKNFTTAQASSPIRFPARSRSPSARPSTRL